MQIVKGRVARAQKVVVYGPEGIGKSSIASQFPDPLFIDTEGSTSNMDVARLPKPTSWTMLLQQIDFVKLNLPCKTLVIDTVDWAERLCTEHVIQTGNKTSITQFGYGEGFIKLEEEYGRMLNKLSDLVELGLNVVLNAHAKITKFEQPDEMGAYDRWELKLGNKTTAKTAPLTKEWADMVLFCNYKTFSVATDDKGKKFKGQGGKRVIYTTHHPAWDAKNRFGLPDELDMNFSSIAHIFSIQQQTTQQVAQQVASASQSVENVQAAQMQNVAQQQTEQPASESATQMPNFNRDEVDYTGIPQGLADLMKLHNVTPQEIMKASSIKGYYPEDTPISNYDPGYINGVLIGAWEQVFAMIKENRTLPF